MKKRLACFTAFLLLFALFSATGQAQDAAPLKLEKTVKLAANIKGHFDHFAVDLKGHRLFATPEDYKAVLVLDLNNWKLIHTISGIERPHAILYRPDLNRLYITDGEAGLLRIYDSKTYKSIKNVPLHNDADSIGYDAAKKILYVVNGGADAHMPAAELTAVNTTTEKKIADIDVPGETLEAMALETSTPKLYINGRNKNQVDVIDRDQRAVIASWPITMGQKNVAMALDEANHRLFVGCRSGHLVVFNTEKGKELQALPISKGVDDLVFDPASKRIYAAADGTVDVYEQTDADHYKLLGKVPSGPVGKTALLIPSMKKYVVAVPQHGAENAQIMIYRVQ